MSKTYYSPEEYERRNNYVAVRFNTTGEGATIECHSYSKKSLEDSDMSKGCVVMTRRQAKKAIENWNKRYLHERNLE